MTGTGGQGEEDSEGVFGRGRRVDDCGIRLVVGADHCGYSDCLDHLWSYHESNTLDDPSPGFW